jgi:hypothetical protein
MCSKTEAKHWNLISYLMRQKFSKYGLGLAFIVTFFMSCRIGDTSSFTTRKPEQKDLIGTWHPTATTIHDMRERGHYNIQQNDTKIILTAEGKIELQNMPDWWVDSYGKSHGSLATSRGAWQLYQANNYWVILLSLDELTTSLSLKELTPPYKLQCYLGDPDSGNEMVFLRQAN